MSGDDRSGPLRPPPASAGRVGSAVGRAVAALALASTRRPLVTVVISLLLAAAGTLYTLHALTFVTSNLRLLPQKASYVVRLKDYQRDFGELNDIVVVVEAASPDRSKAYAARLVADLERQGLARSRITYRVDPAYFEGRGLLYLSQDDLAKLRDRLFDYQEFIEGYAARPTLPRLLAGLNQQIANSMALGFFDVGLRGSGGATDLRFLESVIDQISARLDGQATYTSPWSTAFSVGRLDEPDAGYFFSSDKHWLFLFVQQRREEGNFTDSRSTIEAIRRTIAALRPDFPDVEAGVTGGPAISNDEMSSAFADSEVASILASVLTMALLIGAFRSVVKPVLLMATLTVSLGVVDGHHHAGHRPPEHLLGDVHLHRGGHRRGLRGVLALSLRGGARGRADGRRRRPPDGRAGRRRAAAGSPHRDGRLPRADAHRLPGHPGVRVRVGRRPSCWRSSR